MPNTISSTTRPLVPPNSWYTGTVIGDRRMTSCRATWSTWTPRPHVNSDLGAFKGLMLPTIEVIIDNFVLPDSETCVFGAVLFSATPRPSSGGVYLQPRLCSRPVAVSEAEPRHVERSSTRKTMTILIDGLTPTDGVEGGVVLGIWKVASEASATPVGWYVPMPIGVIDMKTIHIPNPFIIDHPLPPGTNAAARSRRLGYHDGRGSVDLESEWICGARLRCGQLYEE
ncbi:uncharacterized protein B0I36DRAFT_359946 [Microdochium trichocladiopsis]|uniref:Uncharacterized protein n=1 Tax=Microdochium trichocladiopsis TaxID=1682393 RepID=A0A9P8YHQ6_9PEZI|nr:uncharacterized protein B0I36DRAFT_359946 [Microdochium trichocladiopsis]KAH7038370.1 hypothetical protein B0I36DRAFT_359946 [Microdochium trichocladiopsis]